MIEYRQKGLPTYRYYFIKDVFEKEEDIVERWDKDIKLKLDGYTTEWILKINRHKTNYSKLSITLARTFYNEHQIYTNLEIGLYRDGFHITLVDLNDTELRKYLFGDINRSTAWTQEVAKVALIANEITTEIKKFIGEKNKE